jgi:hypothetical protein
VNSNDLRLDEVLRRIDVYGRLAYGGQVVAAMTMVAAPAILVTAVALLVTVWNDNHGEALFYGLGGIVLAVAAEGGGAAFAFFCWRWSGDWITEWPGYAVGFGIAGIANLALAYMLTSTPIPVPGSFAIAIGAAFAFACLIAGNLAGTHVLSMQREERQRSLARRR